MDKKRVSGDDTVRMSKEVARELALRLRKQGNNLQKGSVYVASQFRDHAATAIIAALSFLIALSWKDLIVKIFEDNVLIAYSADYPYLADLVSAIIITFIAIIAIIIVSKWVKRSETRD